MIKTDKRLFKPKNGSLLAKHLNLGSQMVFIWKRNNLDKYTMIKKWWACRCSTGTDLEATNSLLADYALTPITQEHIDIINHLIIKNKVLGRE